MTALLTELADTSVVLVVSGPSITFRDETDTFLGRFGEAVSVPFGKGVFSTDAFSSFTSGVIWPAFARCVDAGDPCFVSLVGCPLDV